METIDYFKTMQESEKVNMYCLQTGAWYFVFLFGVVFDQIKKSISR
jgi:hypothetical protein